MLNGLATTSSPNTVAKNIHNVIDIVKQRDNGAKISSIEA